MEIYPGETRPISYLFIDAESLSYGIQDFSDAYANGIKLELKWHLIRDVHRKVFVYDAIPVQNENEGIEEYTARIRPKLDEISNIERMPGFHVRTGDTRRRKKRGNEQKMVDVHLAVDVLLMASRRLFQNVTIITSDLDFRPLIVALVEMGIDVTLYYRPKATNSELIAAADNAIAMGDNLISSFIDEKKTPYHKTSAELGLIWDKQKFARKITNLVANWNDPTNGECSLYHEPNSSGFTYLAVAHRFPGSDTYNIEVRSNNIDALKKRFLREFGVVLPPLNTDTSNNHQ